jgi:hypothetical protein
MLTLWVLDSFAMPRLRTRLPSWRPTMLTSALIHMVVALEASLLAAWLIHLFLFPGLFGSLRNVLVVGMYTLLFAALGTGVVLVSQYQHSSVAHARAIRDLEL